MDLPGDDSGSTHGSSPSSASTPRQCPECGSPVSDGGPGIRENTEDRRTDRLGIRGLRERVESLGGRFELDSAPDEGTRIAVHLPLDVGE